MIYITHARTPEELKAEVVSDLHRRIDNLTRQERSMVARSAAEKAKIERVLNELQDMLHFWTKLRIERPVRKRNSQAEAKAAAE